MGDSSRISEDSDGSRDDSVPIFSGQRVSKGKRRKRRPLPASEKEIGNSKRFRSLLQRIFR